MTCDPSFDHQFWKLFPLATFCSMFYPPNLPLFISFSLFQCSWHVILFLLISFGTCFHLQHLAQCFISRTVGDIELKFCMCKHEAKIWVHANFQLRILNRSGNSAIQILPWCCQYRYIVPTVPEGICITKVTFNLILPLGLLSLSWINIHISKMNITFC